MKSKVFLFYLLLVVFAQIPFQRRFHGALDSFSRTLTLPEFPLPAFFSTKVHLFVADFLILALAMIVFFRFKVALRTFFWEGPAKYLTLFFLTALVSLFFSAGSHYALQYFRLLQFSTVLLLFGSICSLRDQIDLTAFIRKLCWVLLCVGCIECVIGICQYFTLDSVGLRFLGEPDVRHFLLVNPGKHRWFFDQVFSHGQTADHVCRVPGTFTHPNVLGGFLFCSLMASLYLCMKESSWIRRTFVLGAILLQIFTLYITYSRSAMLALAFAAVLWIALQFKEVMRGDRMRLKRVVLVSSTLLGGILLGIGLFLPQLITRGGIVNYNAVTHYADSERVQYMKMACQMIQDHLFLGVGYNHFQLMADPIQPGYPGHIFYSKVHNIYLLIASETGLIGGGFFLLFLFGILKAGWRAVRTVPDQERMQEKLFLFSTFCGLLLIGACDFYLIDTQQGMILFFGLSGLLYALTAADRVFDLRLETEFKDNFN